MLNSTVEDAENEQQLIQNATSFFSPPISFQNSNPIPPPQSNPSLTPNNPSLFSPTQLSKPVVLSSSNTSVSLDAQGNESNGTNGVNTAIQIEDPIDSEKSPLKENVEQEIDIENMSMDMERSGCGQEGEERRREEMEGDNESRAKEVWLVCKLAYFMLDIVHFRFIGFIKR